MEKGYEYTYETVKNKLMDCDFVEAAARLGLKSPVDDAIKITFLGREYLINSSDVIAADGTYSDPNIRSILIYYITSKGSGEPEYSYSLLKRFIPRSMSGSGTNISWMERPIIREFRNDYNKFSIALKTLGAVYENSPNSYEYIWMYRILPKIPMRILYVKADEEFPCEIKLFLDNGANRFMEFEQLAFLCGCFIRRLIEISKR